MTLKPGHYTKYKVLFPVLSIDLGFLTNYVKLVNNLEVICNVCFEYNLSKLKAATELLKRKNSRAFDSEMKITC